jgi:hypothetical protein
MSASRTRRAVVTAAALAVVSACGFLTTAEAAPPVKVTSQTPPDGPIQYTVKVVSKEFGNAQETRTLRSGQTDDFTWKTVPPGGSVSVNNQCPGYADLPLDANGALLRQTRIRLAPIVASDGTATVQLSFQAQAPRGKATVKSGGKTLTCPTFAATNQVLRFAMPTNGTVKTLTLTDGTQVSVSAKR